MSVRCPHCEHKFALKAEPGVYQPKCPDCGAGFALAILREPTGRVVVAKSLEKLKRHLAKQERATGPAEAATVASAPAAEAPTVASVPAGEMPTVASGPAEQPTAMTPDALATVATPAGGVTHMLETASDAQDGEPLGRLDGYELLRELGAGGMGSVYLARQVSLDRHVAVKTIHPRLARSPAFLARFVREAFAVAQLSHHNVVQVHDVGHDEGQHFFSMEYVAGESLAGLVKRHGPLPPAQAVTHALHAARGLAFAHEHRMVHRDVKPANLLLNDQGLVKVADLGLVKTAGESGVTVAEARDARENMGNVDADATSTRGGAAMGTPAFMPPEQARDAASVDARADVYALGATLYYLLTGRLPLEVRTPEEVIKRHATHAIKPPDQVNPKVPAALSKAVMKMLAKRAADRFQSMSSVVAALEKLLGLGAGPFTPTPEHASTLEEAVEDFNQSAAAKVRRGLYVAFHLVSLLLVLAGVVLGHYALTGTTAWLWACTTAGYLVLSGLLTRNALSLRVRQYLFTLGWVQWLMLAGGVLSFGAMAFVLGLWLYYAAVLVAGLGLAAGFHFVVDRWVARQRGPVLDRVRQMLREMRLRGLDERAVRRFVCAYSGRRWEAMYEALFGYEAKRDARKHWGFDEEGSPRPYHVGWRDGVYDWLERREEERASQHRRNQLQRAEMQRLRAEGVSDMEAMAQSRQHARDWFDAAAIYRETRDRDTLAQVYLNRELTEDERSAGGATGDEPIPDSWKLRPTPLSTVLSYWFLAARARAMVGAVLLVVWAWWARQREQLPSLPEDGGYLQHLRSYLMADRLPLRYPPVPNAVFDVLCSQTALLAGLILVFSGLYRGVRLTVFLLPIVVILLRAPFLGNTIWHGLTHQEWAILLALAMTPPAFFFGKSDY